MGFLVFPVDLVCRIPFVVCLIESETYIVRTVAFVLEDTRCLSVIVNDIDSHNVAVAESFVVRPCGIFLIDTSGDDDRLQAFLARNRLESRLFKSAGCKDRQGRCSHYIS